MGQWARGLERADADVIDECLSVMADFDVDTVLAGLAPRLTADRRAAVAAHCTSVCAAVFVFTTAAAELAEDLRAAGLEIADVAAGVVVRDRLAERYGVGVPEVGVVHGRIPVADGGAREIEVFSVVPGAEFTELAERERLERNEFHLALGVDAADDVLVAGLRALLIEEGGLVADGGGYDPGADRTALYFRGRIGWRGYRRLVLRLRGRRVAALLSHGSTGKYEPAKRLLELMTGAWTTQAIAVAAELGVADAIAAAVRSGASGSADELADRLGVDRAGLGRLLRYLASLGVVEFAGGGYVLTPLGDSLRTAAPHSLRPLALLYGGPFYTSFEALGHAVRTGREGFETVFGRGHFDHFAENPSLAGLFDAAMAASAPMFEPIAELADFSAAAVVVDVAGGNGELLSRILRRHAHLRGVLVERANVLDRARDHLAGNGLAGRCEVVAGDFTRSVPAGGDVYLLSRVLHDWDDEQCRTILRHCAASIRPGAQLLIVERLLPEDDTRSLAVAWDLHMLCNVGGRERSADHYEKLLAETGFELVSVAGLPLDGSLLCARRRADRALR